MIKLTDKPFLEPRKTLVEVERRASLCLRSCVELAGLDELPLPVPVERFIESPLGFTLGVEDLSRFGQGVLGACLVESSEILVTDSLVENDGRFRFTCAHELGHMVMHAKRKKQHFRDTEVGTWTRWDNYEREADRFAAGFLMPVHELVRETLAAIQTAGLDPAYALTELMVDSPQALFLWKRAIMPKLTARFDVSLHAAIHRFLDLRMPDTKPILLQPIADQLFRPLPDHSPVNAMRIAGGRVVARGQKMTAT